MCEIRFTDAKMVDGGLWIKPENIAAAAQFVYEKKDKPYVAALKQYRPPRSNQANKYCWLLMGKMARALKVSDNEVYHRMLAQYGRPQVVDGVVVTISIDARVDLSKNTEDYLYVHSAYIGNSTLGEKEFSHYKLIRGSSEYDTKEMSDFIDGVVDGAKGLGIETMTPAELDILKGKTA